MLLVFREPPQNIFASRGKPSLGLEEVLSCVDDMYADEVSAEIGRKVADAKVSQPVEGLHSASCITIVGAATLSFLVPAQMKLNAHFFCLCFS